MYYELIVPHRMPLRYQYICEDFCNFFHPLTDIENLGQKTTFYRQ